MVTSEEVRAMALTLPRAYEAIVRHAWRLAVPKKVAAEYLDGRPRG